MKDYKPPSRSLSIGMQMGRLNTSDDSEGYDNTDSENPDIIRKRPKIDRVSAPRLARHRPSELATLSEQDEIDELEVKHTNPKRKTTNHFST